MVPRWLVGLLARVVPDDRQDEVIGDLEELHGRRVARWGRVPATVVTLLEGFLVLLRGAVGRGRDAVRGAGRWVSGTEFRLAVRLVRKQPVMTLTSVVALGTGIGIVAGGFSVFQQALYSDLPFSNGDRWVNVAAYSGESGRASPLDVERLRIFRASASALEYIGNAETAEFNVVHASGEIERVAGAWVTPGTFRYLPYRPLLGRLLLPSDGAAAAEPVALIRESLWARRFSRDPGVLGRPVTIAGTARLVVGVLPDDAGYPGEGEIWLPTEEATMGAADDRSPVVGRVVGILAEGATVEGAEGQLQQLSARAASPGSGATSLRLRVTPLTHLPATPQMQIAIFAFMTALLSVLLIISANVANLVVARTSRRAAELAVRTAMGASRGRLVGQLFVETLVIGGLASVLGLAAAGGILALYDRVLDEMPFWIHLGLRPTTAVVVVFVALLATAVTGVLPALRATRKPPGDALRKAGRGALGIGRVGGVMIAAEMALSVALLGSAALFAKGFQLYVHPAFDLPDERVLTARLVLDLGEEDLFQGGAATVADSLAAQLRTLRQSVAALPGVSAVGVASHLPRTTPLPEPMEIEGRSAFAPAPVIALGPGLLDVLEVQPLLGRGIQEEDLAADAPPVALVNQAFAVQNFGTTQVLGRRIRRGQAGDEGPAPWREIVGVVPNVVEVADPARAAGVYVPLAPQRFVALALRVDSDPAALTGLLRRAAYDVDPNLNISDIVRLDEVGGENRTALAVMSSGLTGIGLITLLLSLAGVYSIVSLAVTQRTREIGVRVALGAEPGRILWSVLRRSGVLILGGAILGAGVGAQVSRVRLFVFVVPAGDWWLFPGIVALMGLAGALACWIPARRALAIQPVEALRYDA